LYDSVIEIVSLICIGPFSTSDSQPTLSAQYGFSVRPWFQCYAAVARSLCDR